MSGITDFFRCFRSMTADEGIENGKKLAAAIGCEQEDVEDIAECLRDADVHDIYAQTYALDQPGEQLNTMKLIISNDPFSF